MKSGLFKRVLATGMIALLLAGGMGQTFARAISDPEAVVITEETKAAEEVGITEETEAAEEVGITEAIENLEEAVEVVEANQETLVCFEELTVSGNDLVYDSAVLLDAPKYEQMTLTTTVNHYLGEKNENNIIFVPDSNLTVKDGDTIAVNKGGDSFRVTKITVNDVEVAFDDGGVFCIEAPEGTEEGQNLAVDVYYEPTTGTYSNETTLFDYVDGRATDSKSINYYKNYDNYEPAKRQDLEKDKKKWNTRFATLGAWSDYQLLVKPHAGTNDLVNVNGYNKFGSNKIAANTYPIVKGLLQGVSGENYENVNFTYSDPGFFSNEIKQGKTIYDGFELGFDRTGIMYTLRDVSYENEVVCNKLTEFFPLDALSGGRNEYFGMRYDFTFSIRDYVGKMEYEFTGDDDMWVCMDGAVILDMGGIHGAFPGGTSADEKKAYPKVTYAENVVDVWEYILKKENPTVEDKINYLAQGDNAEKVHTITVLLMERGGTASTCEMKFEIPFVEAKQGVITKNQPAKLNINKVDVADNTAMANVSFTLTDAKGTEVTATTDANGNTSFDNLREGVYTLKEIVPEGYCVAGPWTVTVKSRIEGETVIHSIESVVNTATGEALTIRADGYHTITNTRAELRLVQSKDAKLENWDARRYSISLQASSQTINDPKNGTQIAVANARIVDSIDNRFVVTDEAGNVLEENTGIPDNAGKLGYLKKDENDNWYVEWEDVTIDVAKGDTPGWSATIYVKAKEDFIGGNMIPTNGAGSGIIVNESVVYFSKPTVNVKLRELGIKDREITLFKGEEITPITYISELMGSIVLKAGESKVTLPESLALTELQQNALWSQKPVNIAYSYAGEKVGTFTLVVESTDATANHKAVKVGEAVEKYTLKVTYQADTIQQRAEGLTEYQKPETNGDAVSFDGVEVSGVNVAGEYQINVVAGSLVITKELDSTDVDFTHGDAVFTFKVMKDGNFYSYHTIRYTEGMNGKKTVATLEGLEKGVYTVEECATVRYSLKNVTAHGVKNNPADAEVISQRAVFGIGRTIEAEATGLTLRDGEAVFSNEKTNQRNLSDTDVVVNTFKIKEDGKIGWTADSLKGEE